MQDYFPVYEALWRRAEAEGASVRFGVLAYGAAGYFQPPNKDNGPFKPLISIHRPYYQEGQQPSRSRNLGAPAVMPAPDILAELVTLAHEYGHLMSWKGRTRPEEWGLYHAVAIKRDVAWNAAARALPKELECLEWNNRMRDAMWTALSEDDRSRIVAEEEFAWAIAREVLEELGFGDWRMFNERCAREVHNHRYRLGLDDLWPGDE